MIKFYVMDQSGHSTLEYDLKNDAEVKAAMAKFEELLASGATTASRSAGSSDYTKTSSFDPNADETVFIRPMQGG